MNLMSLLQAGGVTVIILLICSVISWTIVLERFFYYYRRSKIKRTDFMQRISGDMAKGSVDRALSVSRDTDTPFAQVVHAGFGLHGHDEKLISNAMEREIVIETNRLEKNTSVVGSIGSVAVYIGLFGTVLGIIRAFHDISARGSGGISVVVDGISEALICTAVGLAVAVPAVIAYNYFVKRTDGFIVDMELCASEAMDLIGGGRKK